jgi:hypothetical protein
MLRQEPTSLMVLSTSFRSEYKWYETHTGRSFMHVQRHNIHQAFSDYAPLNAVYVRCSGTCYGASAWSLHSAVSSQLLWSTPTIYPHNPNFRFTLDEQARGFCKLLGAFALSREKRLLDASCPSIRLSVSACIITAPTGQIFMKFDIRDFH